jgi:hypothetical protein
MPENGKPKIKVITVDESGLEGIKPFKEFEEDPKLTDDELRKIVIVGPSPF